MSGDSGGQSMLGLHRPPLTTGIPATSTAVHCDTIRNTTRNGRGSNTRPTNWRRMVYSTVRMPGRIGKRHNWYGNCNLMYRMYTRWLSRPTGTVTAVTGTTPVNATVWLVAPESSARLQRQWPGREYANTEMPPRPGWHKTLRNSQLSGLWLQSLEWCVIRLCTDTACRLFTGTSQVRTRPVYRCQETTDGLCVSGSRSESRWETTIAANYAGSSAVYFIG